MKTNSALCCLKIIKKKNERDDDIWRLKRSVRERTKEEMNKSAKNTKWQIWAKRQTNLRVFLFKKETQNRDKPIQSWRGSKTGGKIDVNFVSYYLLLVYLWIPPFSIAMLREVQTIMMGKPSHTKRGGWWNLASNYISNKPIQNTVDQR